MATITLHKSYGNQQFTQATNIAIHGTVLTFDVKTDVAPLYRKKIRTTVPFLIEEDADVAHSF